MKKKILLSLAALALLLSVGCGKAEEDSAQFPTAVKIAEGESEGGQDGAPGNAAAENPSGAEDSQGALPREGSRGWTDWEIRNPWQGRKAHRGIPVFGSV